MARTTLLVLVLLVLLVPAASAQITPTYIAGTGEDITDDPSRGDDGPATEARFHQVDGLDWTLGGNILVADGDDGRIRRIKPSGNIVTNSTEGLADPIAVVGTGVLTTDPFERHNFVVSDVGDNTVEDWFLLSNFTWSGTAIMEDIDAHDVEAALDGYWVTDSANGMVWHLTFFGFPVGSWHQAPALEDLDEPEGIGPLPGGGFLVATNGSGDCRIRRRADGVTTVVAGTSGLCSGPTNGGNGDGGPATAAWLGFPIDVEATPDGGFVMIERDRVRHVAPDGTISTIYVTGLSPSPDFPAPQPTALEVTPDGDVLIGLIRRVLRFDTNYAPPAGTTPPPGGTNPLPPPPPGPDSDPLTATLSKSAYKVVKGKKLKIVFTAGSAGAYVLDIRKGKKLAKRFKGAAKAGKNTLKKKVGLPPGRYKIAFKLKAGGETATDTAKLRVTRPG